MPNVYIRNLPNAEDNAMLGSLYSRSVDSVTEHLKKVEKAGSGKFMSQYYLGYGHASIAELGFTTIYLEGISMLAAKAIEDSRLFKGQESSSRYIDFSTQPFVFPEGFDELEHAYRDFYVEGLRVLREELPNLFPKEVDTPDAQYQRAIDAKAFDILRGFLPCGATTNVAWVTDLRTAKEHLELLFFHPFKEISDLAEQTYSLLKAEYPNSFEDYIGAKTLAGTEEEIELRSNWHNFYGCDQDPLGDRPFELMDTIEQFDAWAHYPIMRPTSTKVIPSIRRVRPKHTIDNSLVHLEITTTIDFGSFRDLQRHRGGYCSNEVPSINFFADWYMYNLPESMKEKAYSLFSKVVAAHEALPLEDETMISYMLPMGCTVDVVMYYSLTQAIYVAELRSSKMVHPTLRSFAQRLASYINDLNIQGAQCFADFSASEWDVRRGAQTILEK